MTDYPLRECRRANSPTSLPGRLLDRPASIKENLPQKRRLRCRDDGRIVGVAPKSLVLAFIAVNSTVTLWPGATASVTGMLSEVAPGVLLATAPMFWTSVIAAGTRRSSRASRMGRKRRAAGRR
jgi:hypothetical protein